MPRYYAYAEYIRHHFGHRVQKLSIDAGFTCPNRDGSIATTGCAFCNNEAFNPAYCRIEGETPLSRTIKPISKQIDEGITFHQWRYRKATTYLAYFQAYSNTYAPLSVLQSRYEEALRHPQVEGLIIGTRPDCVDDEKLDYLQQLSQHYYIAVEYGIESCYNDTLQRVARGHTFDCTRRAVLATAQRGIPCGGHLIFGLPGDDPDRLLAQATLLNPLPLTSLKIHQLQLLKGTTFASEYHQPGGTVHFPQWTLNDYIPLVCDFVERLRPDLAIERFAGEVPPRYQIDTSRSWRRPDGRLLRNEEIPILVEQELERRGTWQGCRYGNERR